MLSQDERWLLTEKYNGVDYAPVFNESLDEIKNKYPWGEAFHADCERLAKGEPLGFVIGFVPFLDCKIWLDSHPLIPRPETEFWVEKAITEIEKKISAKQIKSPGPRSDLGLALGRTSGQSYPNRILDLCAGSGAIGAAVAKAIPNSHVTFGELEPTHLPTIHKNIEENCIMYDTQRFTVVTSDVFDNIAGQFDFILSNPPYIDPALDRVEDSVRTHEPLEALYGGEGGMELIERIIIGARAKLAHPHGQLWLEHEPEQIKAINQLAAMHGFSATTHNDQYDVARYSILVLQ